MLERMRRNFAGLGLLAITAMLLGACGSGSNPTKSAAPAPAAASPSASGGQADFDAAVAAAKKEKLVVVTHPGPPYEAFINAFKKAYPDIPVEEVEQRPSDIATKMLTEQKNGVFSYDVWWDATSTMNTVVIPAGGFQDLKPFLVLPDVTNPSNWNGGKLLFTSDSQPFVLVHSLYLPGDIYVNRDVAPKDLFVAGKPFNPTDLLDPRIKGKILFRTPDSPQGGSLNLTGLLKSNGADFVKKLLVDQQPIFEENAELIAQQLIQGKGAIEIGGDTPTIQTCLGQGGCKNISTVIQQSYALATGIGVLKGAPHPNAAKVFVNWTLTKVGQQAFVDAYASNHQPGANSDRVDVEGKDPDHAVDFSKLAQISVQGTDAGSGDMTQVLSMYKQISSK